MEAGIMPVRCVIRQRRSMEYMLQYTGRGITAHRRAVQFEDWYAVFRWNRQQADVHAQNVQAVKRDERMAVFSVVRNWMCLGYAQQDSAASVDRSGSGRSTEYSFLDGCECLG